MSKLSNLEKLIIARELLDNELACVTGGWLLMSL